MQIAKLRVRDATGLVPAGRYFEQLAKSLRTANAREYTRTGDAEDRALEASYRRAPARFESAKHTPM
jgi:hypothetical protein